MEDNKSLELARKVAETGMIMDATALDTHEINSSGYMDKDVVNHAISSSPVPAQFMPRKPRQVVKDNKIGRNDPCPCGSGKKYKNCCLNSGEYETYHTL